MKKVFICLMALVLTLTLGFSVSLAEETVKLEVCIGGEVNEDSMAMLKTLFDEYTAESGVQVEVVSNGNDHEAVMKTRMASNDMPDLWSTHGWSVLRYGDYAMDLSDQAWAANMDGAIGSVVTDSDGKVDACPLTQWVYAMVYDQAVLDANGIDPASIQTWDDLFAASTQLAAAGITPFSVGTKDGSSLAGFLEMMNSFYSIDGAPYAANEALKDGTFDFTQNTQIFDKLAEIFDNGWFNEDIFTADNVTALQYLGTGNYAFLLWGGTSDISALERYFPDRSYGFIAIPAVSEGGNAAITVGEGTCFAVSKDTPHAQEALALLDFLTRPENVARYVAVNGGLPGFQDITVEDNPGLAMYQKAVAAAGDHLVFSNFFDREYLPSGMWNAMQESMATLYNGDVGTAKDRVAEAAESLQDAYVSLY